MRRKAGKDDDIPAVIHLELSPKEFRKKPGAPDLKNI
jgi:hypothetical protein